MAQSPSTACGGAYLLAETVITPVETKRKYGVSVQAFHRYRLTGLRGGVRLEAYLRGSRWITSEEALIRFFDRVNAAARGERVDTGETGSAGTRTEGQRRAASERAARACLELGV